MFLFMPILVNKNPDIISTLFTLIFKSSFMYVLFTILMSMLNREFDQDQNIPFVQK